MIISHKHKFIFMHTPKCAGSSIEVSLASVCDEGDLIGPVTSEGLPDDYKHPNTFEEHQEETGGIYNGMRAEEIKNYIGDDIWNEYFKFSVVRNPWDRAISFWHWRDREKLINKLYKNDIYPGVHYVDNTLYRMYGYANGSCPNAHRYSDELITLPIHLGIEEDDCVRIVEILKEIL